MPRTFQATIAMIITLAALALLTLVNVIQTNSSESKIAQLTVAVEKLETANKEIKDQLQRGVAVNGTQNNTGSSQTPTGPSADKYASALKDPNNMLKPRSKALIPAGAQEGGTLRQLMGDDPKGFNWLLENSVDVANLQALVHDGLAQQDFDDPDNWTSQLAYKITVNDDFTEYTIHLREGVLWHTPAHPSIDDPKHQWMKEKRFVKAEDVKFLVDLIKNPQVEAGSARNYFEDLDRIEIIDDYTLKAIWKKKTYVSRAATLGLYPMPKWLFTKEEDGTAIPEATLGLKFNNHWASQYALGTGPYKFVKFEKGVSLELTRNEDYWGEKPPIKNIFSVIVKDPEQSLVKLKADEIDYNTLRPAQYNSEILKGNDTPFTRGEIQNKIVDRFAYYYIGWNADQPLFADKMVRRAMTLAFNRQGLIKNVFFDLGEIQTGPFYYKHTANDPSVKPFNFNLDEAKRLLDEAGWKDSDGNGIRDKMVNNEKKEFKFTILAYAGSPEWQSSLSVFKEDLRKIGVTMDYSPVDWPTMQKKMDEKKFDAYTGGWGLGWEIDPYQLWHSSQADEAKGSNRVGFRNKRADEIIVALRETFDTDKRTELAREFHRILHEEQPYTFFFAPKSVFAWHNRLQNPVVQKIRPQFYQIPWWLDPKQAAKK